MKRPRKKVKGKTEPGATDKWDKKVITEGDEGKFHYVIYELYGTYAFSIYVLPTKKKGSIEWKDYFFEYKKDLTLMSQKGGHPSVSSCTIQCFLKIAEL